MERLAHGRTEVVAGGDIPGEDLLDVVFQYGDFRILRDQWLDRRWFADYVVKTDTSDFCRAGGAYRIERRCIPVSSDQALGLILAVAIPEDLRDLLLARLLPEVRDGVRAVMNGDDLLFSPFFPCP